MRQRETREKTIGEFTYKVTLLGAKAGRTMSVRLLKILGPTVAAFVEGTVGAKSGDGDISLAVGASEMVREVVNRLSIDDVTVIQDEFAKQTTVVLDSEHEPRLTDIFDDHFAGHYDDLISWTRFALEVNFTSFFAGSVGPRGLIGRLMTLIASNSKSPPASTGTSTASPPASTTASA
jgi:hypothetical protein